MSPAEASGRSYAGIIVDLDGCVWVGGRATPGAPDAIAAWREHGGRIVFATNEPRHSPEAQVRRLWEQGIRASADEMVTSGAVLEAHLAANHAGASAFVIGTEAIIKHVMAAGLRPTNNLAEARAAEADVVVISGHDRLSFAELRIATRAGLAGAHLVATGRDPVVPTPDGPIPGTGAIVAAVETAVGRAALSVGKPEPWMFALALERLGEGPALVIGDRLDSDVAGAAGAGLDGALVLSGSTDSAALDAWTGPAPVLVAPTLADLLAKLLTPR